MRSPGMKYTVCLLVIFCAITLLAFTTSPVYATAEPFVAAEDNPQLAFFPLIQGPTPAKLVIAAAHIDSAISYEPDEAVMLWNVGGSEVEPGRLADRGQHTPDDDPVDGYLNLGAGSTPLVRRTGRNLPPFVRLFAGLRVG